MHPWEKQKRKKTTNTEPKQTKPKKTSPSLGGERREEGEKIIILFNFITFLGLTLFFMFEASNTV